MWTVQFVQQIFCLGFHVLRLQGECNEPTEKIHYSFGIRLKFEAFWALGTSTNPTVMIDDRTQTGSTEHMVKHWQSIFVVHTHTTLDRTARQMENHFTNAVDEKWEKKRNVKMKPHGNAFAANPVGCRITRGSFFYQKCFQHVMVFLWKLAFIKPLTETCVWRRWRRQRQRWETKNVCLQVENTNCVSVAHEWVSAVHRRRKCARKMFCVDTVGPVVVSHTQRTIPCEMSDNVHDEWLWVFCLVLLMLIVNGE